MQKVVNIKQLQHSLFEMWVYLDNICKINNIKYFFAFGCLLGAVREQDFIPWDDDMDLVLMRDDYEKLRTVLKKMDNPRYKFVEPNDLRPYFHDFIPRIVDIETPLHDETDEDRAYKNLLNRASIDLFIFDSVPDNKWLQKWIIVKSKFYYGLARSKRFRNKYDEMSVHEAVCSAILFVLGKTLSFGKVMNLYDTNTRKYHEKKSHSIIVSNAAIHYIKIYDKSDYKETAYLPFHGTYVPVPIGYDNVLKKTYGDYMTPRRYYKGYTQHFFDTSDMANHNNGE